MAFVHLAMFCVFSPVFVLKQIDHDSTISSALLRGMFVILLFYSVLPFFVGCVVY